ncbi:MAG: ATP-grasp domain-containing protein [Candidatus Hydrogenedentes bacterium]|nr:ATP-grasp domain-containing protein [Candidatus Hydrogenedentota bacterium]
MTFEGKKLLHVGGAMFQTPAIGCAKALGCEVILVDKDNEAPGIAFADVFEPVSTTDREGVLEVARRHEINGVMTYASDSSTATVAYVAHELGLPGSPLAAAELLQRKDRFRQFQHENGIPHPRFVTVDNPAEAESLSMNLPFPLVIKPVDSAGTKGQSVIHSREEIRAAYLYAVQFSGRGKVILERYIESNALELDGDVFFQNGELRFRHYGHNYFMRDRLSNVPCGEIFPGFFGPKVTRQLDEQFRTLISALNLECGCINFDGFISRETVYIIDIGLRNGGNFVPELIALSTGFDLTRAAVCAALDVQVPCTGNESDCAEPVASYLVGSRSAGTLRDVTFSPDLAQYLVEYRPFLAEGSPVVPFTRSDRAAGVAFFRFPDMAALEDYTVRMESLVTIALDHTDKAQVWPQGVANEIDARKAL